MKNDLPVLVVGSVAMLRHLPHYRSPGRDLDIVGPLDKVNEFIQQYGVVRSVRPYNDGKKIVARMADGRIVEAELTSSETGRDLYLTAMAHGDVVPCGYNHSAPNLNFLYALKMSHRYLKDSPHFLKTHQDIMAMRGAGAVMTPPLVEFMKRREKATYTYAHPKLDVTKANFFNGDGVHYVYDHDSIHQAVKQLEKPAYTYFKHDEHEVKVDRELFYRMSDSIKLASVLEEAMVLAIERSIIPHPGKKTRKEAFDMALMKVCTSITSGWWREFAWENYHDVQKLYYDSYVDDFWDAVNEGIVKPYQQPAMA